MEGMSEKEYFSTFGEPQTSKDSHDDREEIEKFWNQICDGFDYDVLVA